MKRVTISLFSKKDGQTLLKFEQKNALTRFRYFIQLFDTLIILA